jgi:hypothetical protein
MNDGATAAESGGDDGGTAADTETTPKGRESQQEDDDYVETRFEKVNNHNLAKRHHHKEGGDVGDKEGSDKTPPAAKSPPPLKGKTENEKKAEQIVEDNDNVEKIGAKKYSVVIDGERHEVTEEELLKGYQTRKASDKRFMEASQKSKQAETFLSLIKNPATLKQVLSDPRIGIDVRKWAEDVLYEELQLESMDPKDKELMDYKEKLRKYEEQERKVKEEQETKDREELKTKYAQDYHKDIITALDGSGLPRSATTVKKMAYYMHQAAKKGFKLGAADVVDLVREDYTREIKDLYGSADAESLLALLGDDNVNKINEYQLAKAKKGFPKTVPRENQGAGKETRVKKKELSKEVWKEKLQRIKDGLE